MYYQLLLVQKQTQNCNSFPQYTFLKNYSVCDLKVSSLLGFTELSPALSPLMPLTIVKWRATIWEVMFSWQKAAARIRQSQPRQSIKASISMSHLLILYWLKEVSWLSQCQWSKRIYSPINGKHDKGQEEAYKCEQIINLLKPVSW